MKAIVFLVTGVILMAVGLLVSQQHGGVSINGSEADPATAQIAIYAMGGGLGGLGAIFTLGGLISLAFGSRQAKRNQYIMQTGVDAVGTVTFMDKNYSLLVNNAPAYSILEYTYQDGDGRQHTRRIDNVDSELVIRRQIQVGARVAIKYSAENPGESVIIF